ncbi:MAG: threonine synthase [Acidobacteria bacterium]|nr:threonine synthase [Acidobacteriota bacterium]
MARAALIDHYRKLLPLTHRTPVVSLMEGFTPLIRAPRIGEIVGAQVYLKYEGLNPTGSFKDRGMTMAVSKALEAGAQAVICASTGNTSASAAAYAARAGIRCVVLIPEGKVALGKLAQVAIAGADLVAIDGNFDEALNLVRDLSDRFPLALANSVNPFRIDGQMTGAFEVVDELGDAPDYHALPVGNAGNITAYWRGYQAYKAAGYSRRLPVMLGFQAAGAAPIVLGRVVDQPETVATAIRIGNPASWATAVAARDESGGSIDAVTDDEILEAYQLLVRSEGVFCEPASAASVAGVIKRSKQHPFRKRDVIVCVLTGHGLKDPQTAVDCTKEVARCPAALDALAGLLGLR